MRRSDVWYLPFVEALQAQHPKRHAARAAVPVGRGQVGETLGQLRRRDPRDIAVRPKAVHGRHQQRGFTDLLGQFPRALKRHHRARRLVAEVFQ